MKTMLVLILTAAAFLGGYWCAKQPGSPDIFAMAKDYSAQANDAGKKISALLNGEKVEPVSDAPGEEMTVTVDGKTYRIGKKTQSDFAPRH